jgi:hypothetical protein
VIRLRVQPVRRLVRDELLGVNRLEGVGYRAEGSDGYRGKTRSTVAAARADVRSRREQLADEPGGVVAGERPGRCNGCGARNSGDPCYACGDDQRPRLAGRRERAAA